MVDIFKDAKEKTVPTWAKFVNDGDSYQGTYIGKIVGQKDGYGNEQIIYQLLQEDESIINVGFGLNKKVLHKDMEEVKFGQIVGIRYKGTVSIKDRHTGKMLDVKDFALHFDPKIVNTEWLKANKDNMPVVEVAGEQEEKVQAENLDSFVEGLKEDDDVPFSSGKNLTNADKLKAIEKLATEKLADLKGTTKEKVVEATGKAFIPANYDVILELLAAKGF